MSAKRGELTSRRTQSVVISVVVLLAIGASAATAAVGSRGILSNSVLSRHIKNGQVAAPDIRAKAVRRHHLFTGAVNAPAIAGGAVTAPKIAAKAVTPMKLSTAGSTSGQMLTSSGSAASWVTPEFEPAFAHTVVVRSNGSAAENGTALLAAIAAISDATATAPYLVQLEPGTYDVAGTKLEMKPNVHLAGAGMTVTTIIGAPAPNMEVVLGANGTSIADLSVQGSSSGSGSAIIVPLASIMQLTSVWASMTSSTPAANVLGLNVAGTATVRGSLLSADSTGDATSWGQGLYTAGTATVYDSEIRGNSPDGTGVAINNFGTTNVYASRVFGVGTNRGAIYAQGTGTVRVHGGTLVGAVGEGGAATMQIASAMLDGASGGTPACVGVYDEDFVALNANCA